MVTAIVLIDVEADRIGEVAQQIADLRRAFRPSTPAQATST